MLWLTSKFTPDTKKLFNSLLSMDNSIRSMILFAHVMLTSSDLLSLASSSVGSQASLAALSSCRKHVFNMYEDIVASIRPSLWSWSYICGMYKVSFSDFSKMYPRRTGRGIFCKIWASYSDTDMRKCPFQFFTKRGFGVLRTMLVFLSFGDVMRPEWFTSIHLGVHKDGLMVGTMSTSISKSLNSVPTQRKANLLMEPLSTFRCFLR